MYRLISFTPQDHDRLGRVVCKPVVYNSGTYKCTKLRWYPIGGTKRSKGDLLAAFEMFKLGSIELPPLPPYDKMKHPVPADIRPQLQLTRVEVCVSNYPLQAASQPF